MKYLNKLHDDIARLKIENANLRNSLKSNLYNSANDAQLAGPEPPMIASNDNIEALTQPLESKDAKLSNEISIPFLDKYGKLINSRTGERIYVGSSSMTLFGLELNNLLPYIKQQNSTTSSPQDERSPASESTTVLEREGNAYRIRLGQTKLSPQGIAVNFTLPSYSYALLLVDTFISYNDGCFYFFNEGLVKENLRRIYKGEKLFLISEIHDTREVTIETIWFCQLLLIFAVGEMYLGTANSPNGNKLNKSKKKHHQKPKLPGSEFFYQASELFTGLFSSGAITNCVLEGGVEVMLLYAFYLQVADCTIASYFYFGSLLRACLMLGLHVDAGKENLFRYELEHRRRLFWTVFMFERMLASKAGLPLTLTDDYVSSELPDDFDMSHPPVGCEFYIFPELEYIKNCVKITTINASILSSLYSKQPNSNILPVVNGLVLKLLDWKNNLPSILQCDFSKPDLQISRLIVNMMTEYFQGMNLAVRPLLMHFTLLQLKQSEKNSYVDLSSYSKQLLTLLNSSFQAAINTIRSLWALMPENMVALFGYMDREYLFTSAATLILFNCAFGVYEATFEHLDHALVIFTKMRNLGNHPALLRRAQLLKLLTILDFNGSTQSLISKHDDDYNAPIPNTDNMVSSSVKADEKKAAFNIQQPLTPEVFNQYLSHSSNEVEMELWNDITNQAMWLSGDVGEEFNHLLNNNNSVS